MSTTTAYQSTTSTARGTASLVLGVCSLFAGWIFIAPLIGFFLGISSRKREPGARGRAGWGIALNLIAMSVWIVATIIVIVTGGIAAFVSLGNG